MDNIIENFCKNHKKASYNIKGYDHFDDRVIFMKVNMSKEGKILHDELIDELDKVSYINFDKHDGKNKIFHVTITSKKIQKIFYDIWDYVSYIPCEFDCEFDNISVYKWENNTWVLHKEFLLS